MKARDLGTELCLAIFHAQPEKVKELLELGADVNAIADRRIASVGENTPLWEAVSGATKEIFPAWKDLCEGLSDLIPTIPRRDIADKRQRYLTIIRKLLDCGADLEKSCHGSTPLRIAVHGNDLEVVRLLLEKGANPNAETLSVLSRLARKQGRRTIPAYYDSVLHEAVEKNSPAIVRALLEAGADSSRQDHEGKTPLQIAREKGFLEIGELLERFGTNNAKD